jgi:hypothetical protein
VPAQETGHPNIPSTQAAARGGLIQHWALVSDARQLPIPLAQRNEEPLMASYLLIRHKVTDFKTWKVGYDSHRAMRTEAGLTEKYLLRSADDPNEVVALFEAQDIDRAKGFAASAELREKMQEFGVADRPDIYFLNG